MVDHATRHALLLYARRCLEAVAERRQTPPPIDIGEHDSGAGVFVTLRKNGELRGCVGDVSFKHGLTELVRAMTREAAISDPRFPAVDRAEVSDITIEVSQLTRPRRATLEEIVLGRHGIVVEHGGRRGLLLPQVADELGCTRADFVWLACQKAGIRESVFSDRDFTLHIFEAEVFQE